MTNAAEEDRGDYQGFLALDRRFRGPLKSYFQRRTSQPSDAEDLTQEVFLRLTRYQASLSQHNVEALVFTIAANLLRDRGRRRAVRGVVVSLDQDSAANHDASLVEVLQPERVLLGRDDLKRALAALDELGDRTQAVFVMQRFEGLKNKEIARELGISVSAVEKHMVKALTHIAGRVARG